ncbi:glycosyltransferase, MGT family protein [Burkholderia ambifaria AMMD]|uniref:UDP-glucuronosyl/UDP-glucosyltransferase n=1 Tax=Burkholderia ambifaria (strain ATCC BAA-244 / DSM 16087 / CCUG 44356 / LMG 19182 / AMMD) TaxID=339670 RepID=Q0B238_BURCM|nr:nucleotide disphospho-sugar-binding domain-containing protein [Burkholderia ambifaria]ABI91785.1 UDP-glucuronosyl/UDP-glucosyltransferase [Burkholderia ambifaria AMMD]AJY26632.1 glycosyltransferase, MGT family protein [Burkholderia ambifaria AMMD]MBR7932424.1 glycosyltransferase [Burkholderia ambifaria]PEH70351.1 UDP-glucosyltransferase [Burkholderia ambifaria]QQC08473.1 glycosyltransferase [Burkholderia ambifaria]
MKIVLAATPLSGHANPMLSIARILIDAGHDVIVHTGCAFQERADNIGAAFHPLRPAADFAFGDPHSKLPSLEELPPGLERQRLGMELVLVDYVIEQHLGLQQLLREVQADIVFVDHVFLGILPMLLGPRSNRPPVAMFNTTILHWSREDGAPHYAGLPPATSRAQRERYAAIAREHDRIVYGPLVDRLNRYLAELGVGPIAIDLCDLVVALPDVFMQLTVPEFEFPRTDLPASVRFIGALPIEANQVPLPSWASELTGDRKVVLVTQGTVANHDFRVLVAPALEALAHEPDLLVVVSTGGRPVDTVPGPIPANARVASYLPFEWLLPSVDVFVTNGGYGSVNQAISYGIPLVTAGLTEDKADGNARVAWSGVGIDLATHSPTPDALRAAVRTVLDNPRCRQRVTEIAEAFKSIDTRGEILRIMELLTQPTTGSARGGNLWSDH